MILLFSAFFAGIITVLAPCVFALLPVIVGGSMSGDVHDKRRPFIIAGSLAVSLIVFTLLLKATTLFINVPPEFITGLSGTIIILLGLTLLFPSFYERILITLNLQAKSQQLLAKSGGKGPVLGAVITGAALGPVFSSCSPVYAYILATILPVNFGAAMVYITSYVLGLSLMLLLVGFLGQKVVRRLKWASNPKGWFTRIVAILFIITGFLIVSGFDKRFQTFIANNTAFDFDSISAQLIPERTQKQIGGVLNVKPYEAPEIRGIDTWINSNPQTLESLKGKVVLIDFWTYSCINCIRTQPYLKDWHEKYEKDGLVIIGVHAPEFSFEKNPENVKKAVKEAEINYPVAMDNDFKTWRAYENSYWPATYLIDKDGQIRRTHFGEGEYKEQEAAIRQLLMEKGGKVSAEAGTVNDSDSARRQLTPETYLGLDRVNNFFGSSGLVAGTNEYQLPKLDRVNQWTLGGTWSASLEGITAVKNSTLRYRVQAKDVYVVTGDSSVGTIEVFIDGVPASQAGAAGSDVKDSKVAVSSARLYRIVSFKEYDEDAEIELRVTPGIKLNTFTFGG